MGNLKSSRIKMKILIVAVFLLGIMDFTTANCRNIRCYLKVGPSITSPSFKAWEYQTCAFSMTCSRAHGRVPSRCDYVPDQDDDVSACTKVCGGKSVCQKTVDVYLTGKADCKGDTLDPNTWMVPKKLATVCCLIYNGQIFTRRC